MHQRRAEENDMAKSNSTNRNSFLGSNNKEHMEVCVTKMKHNFGRYQGDLVLIRTLIHCVMDDSSDEDHSNSSCNSRYRLRTRSKSK